MRHLPIGGYVYREEDRRFDRGLDEGAFDRMAYAMRALRVLRPAGMTVAVCETRRDLRIERGRAWERGPDGQWAVVWIPPTASRHEIAVALAGLVGLDRSSLAVAVLMTGIEQH